MSNNEGVSGRQLIESAGTALALVSRLMGAIEDVGGDRRDLELAVGDEGNLKKLAEGLVSAGSKKLGYPVRVGDRGAVDFPDFLRHCGIENQSPCLRDLVFDTVIGRFSSKARLKIVSFEQSLDLATLQVIADIQGLRLEGDLAALACFGADWPREIIDGSPVVAIINGRLGLRGVSGFGGDFPVPVALCVAEKQDFSSRSGLKSKALELRASFQVNKKKQIVSAKCFNSDGSFSDNGSFGRGVRFLATEV